MAPDAESIVGNKHRYDEDAMLDSELHRLLHRSHCFLGIEQAPKMLKVADTPDIKSIWPKLFVVVVWECELNGFVVGGKCLYQVIRGRETQKSSKVRDGKIS